MVVQVKKNLIRFIETCFTFTFDFAESLFTFVLKNLMMLTSVSPLTDSRFFFFFADLHFLINFVIFHRACSAAFPIVIHFYWIPFASSLFDPKRTHNFSSFRFLQQLNFFCSFRLQVDFLSLPFGRKLILDCGDLIVGFPFGFSLKMLLLLFSIFDEPEILF